MHATTTKDTTVLYYLRPVVGKADGFYRALTKTKVTVLALYLLQFQI